MDTLAYTQAYRQYEELEGIEYEPLNLKELDWIKLPNATWLGLLTVGVIAATLSAAPASAQVRVDTPNNSCLNARVGPGTGYDVYTCVSDGAALKDVVDSQGDWLELSSGRWVYGPYTTYGKLSGQSASIQAKVDTPNNSCLNARVGPGTGYDAYTCVSDGAALKPVVASRGNWLQLSSGGWVYGPYTTTGSGGTGGTIILKPGQTGTPVRDVQLRLQSLGYYDGAIDSIYGPKTTNAVKEFQRAKGLMVDGIVGPNTRQALF
ncbi:peptidoglycan-binding domain-containing protein [Spirulina sp. CS-785/01]|uniref:peptidoglycan-binding domain-containing protein n=1 Tax=Spirulina sp. CS-785/01 TaxID=3021716 RepID=UPI00232C8B40|nr:peptidoglycan-binding domain-containing protein [Spirulina sp. CS-785/01]MDB9313643.1 peptidoglycan-binding domain-containing protein [Spirulina sp. CS-785/01]